MLKKVIVDKDLVGAEKALLALPGLKRYKKSLRSKLEQEHFLSHIRKYISMYSTDCAWEVSTTNRYTIVTYEAAVTARRRIKQGDKVKYLIGTLVPLTTEESADLDMTNRNFSIVVSSRKKNSSIFLGPARFANHDCDANGRLVTTGPDGMEVVAMKNIEVGDEITVSYGDDYFGPNNIDCLCHTCEILERNGWTSKAALLDNRSQDSTPAPSRMSSVQARGLKRKFESDLFSFTSSSTPPSKAIKTTQSPSKLQQSWTPPTAPESELPEDASTSEAPELSEAVPISMPEQRPVLSPPRSPHQSIERDVQVNNSEITPPTISDTVLPSQPAEQGSDSSVKLNNGRRESKMTARLLGKVSSRAPLSPAPTSPSSHGSATETAATTHLPTETNTIDPAVTIKIETTEITKVEADEDAEDTIVVAASRQESTPLSEIPSDLVESDESPDAVEEVAESAVQPLVPHVISTLTTTTITKDVHNPDVSVPVSETHVLPSIEQAGTSVTRATLTVHPVTGTIRIAGDYILTRKLLAQPHDRWVQCHNTKCYGFFIQPNGYQTRKECPRCERHSMLYGFPWPKTDPDPRKLLERKSQSKKRENASVEYSAYRRKGRCGKGTWVEGGGDEEERVMDHRTIHRFVLPEEERELTRNGLLKEAELAREAGDVALAMLEAKFRSGSRAFGTESAARDGSESGPGSATPDDARRRSNRFVTRPVGVYTDKY